VGGKAPGFVGDYRKLVRGRGRGEVRPFERKRAGDLSQGVD